MDCPHGSRRHDPQLGCLSAEHEFALFAAGCPAAGTDSPLKTGESWQKELCQPDGENPHGQVYPEMRTAGKETGLEADCQHLPNL